MSARLCPGSLPHSLHMTMATGKVKLFPQLVSVKDTQKQVSWASRLGALHHHRVIPSQQHDSLLGC